MRQKIITRITTIIIHHSRTAHTSLHQNWKNLIKNDFEESIFPKHPQLAQIKEELYAHGALYAAMSGSGSSMFGIFKKEPLVLPQWEKHFHWKDRL